MALKYGSFKDLQHVLEVLRGTLITLLDDKDRKVCLTYCVAITGTVQRIVDSPAFAALTGSDLNEIGNKCEIILLGVVAIREKLRKSDPSMN